MSTSDLAIATHVAEFGYQQRRRLVLVSRRIEYWTEGLDPNGRVDDH